MSETKHTPGPWRATKPAETADGYVRNATILAERSTWIADVVGASEVCQANARLIAAAPDLLAACKAAYDTADRLLDMLHDDRAPDFNALSDDIREAFSDIHCATQPAIAKAKGE